MQFFSVHPAIYGTSIILAVMPILLFAAFAATGRLQRKQRLLSSFKKEATVGDVLYDATVDPNLPLHSFLQQKYDEAHALNRYWLPLLAFYIVYGYGLYWSCVTFDFALDPANSIWTTEDTRVLPIALIASAGYFGSALTVIWHLFWRTMCADVQPRSFIHFAARLVVAPILAVAIAKGIFFRVEPQQVVLFIAFGCGMLTVP